MTNISLLSNFVSNTLSELQFLGAVLILIGISYKFISAIQLVVNVLKSTISEQTLPAMLALGSIAVTVGISGSNYIFLPDNRFQWLQNDLILPLIHVFISELVIVFLISKRPKIKKYTLIIAGALIAILLYTANYSYIYTLISLFIFAVATLQYKRVNSIKKTKEYSVGYLKFILATSIVLSAIIILNVVLNANIMRPANILLVILVVAFTQYEFLNLVMGEIDYL